MGKQDDFFKTQIRIPTDIYGEIKDLAEEEDRSINGQIVYLFRIALDQVNVPISEDQMKELLREVVQEEFAKQNK